MRVYNTLETWGVPAKAFHWISGVIVLGMLAVGLVMTRIEDLGLKFELYQLHKSFGVLVFLLTGLRFGWRRTNPTPALPAGMPGWQRDVAHGTHWLLYGLLVALPITGFLMVSTSPFGIPTVVFGLVTLPHPIGPDAALTETLAAIHRILAYALILVVGLHVGGALKHHFIERDRVLRRMLP